MDFYAYNYKPKYYVYILLSIVIHIVLAILFLPFLVKSELKIPSTPMSVELKYISSSETSPSTERAVKEEKKVTKGVETSQLLKKPAINIKAPSVPQITPQLPTAPSVPTPQVPEHLSIKETPEKPLETINKEREGEDVLRGAKVGGIEETVGKGKEQKQKFYEDIGEGEKSKGKKGEGIGEGETMEGWGKGVSEVIWEKDARPRKVIKWVKPEFPQGLLKASTTVTVRFFIAPNGKVIRVSIVKSSGNLEVDEILKETMEQIEFEPIKAQEIQTALVTFTLKVK